MKLKALIIDDEYPIRQELRYLLGQLENIEVVGEAAGATEAMKLIMALEYDILFLDISLPGMNGLDLAEKVQSLPYKPQVIFITAYDNYALDAFNVSATDYILKPIDKARLRRAVDKVARRSEADRRKSSEKPEAGSAASPPSNLQNEMQNADRILAEYKGRIVLVDILDICFIFTEADKVYFKMPSDKLLVKYTLKDLESKLSGRSFFRTHRSFIVNIKKIREIQPLFNGTYQLIINDKEKSEVPVSRSQAQKLRKMLG